MSINNNIYHQPVWCISNNKKAISLHQSSEKLHNPLLLIGGVHGDEPEGVYLAEATLEWLKTQSSRNLRDWMLITCLNPDGYENNQRVNGAGVDLNRNYPSKDWKAEYEKPRYKPGPNAASEPEIKKLVELIKLHQPSLIIHCHSWKPCIVSSGPKFLYEAQVLSEASQYELKDNIGYPTPGSLSQYAWHDLNIPVICIEEREGADKKETWERFSTAITKIFKHRSETTS